MRYLLFLLVSIVVVSCDNDFELVADYKETPVVYGIIDQGDSILDGNEIGLQRDLGVFANDPNYLYQIRTDAIPLIAEEQIEIRVEGVFEDRAVTAMAPILKPAFFINPSNESVIGFLKGMESQLPRP